MRMLRAVANAATLAVFLLPTHVAQCAGAAPSFSVVNLPSALGAGSVMTADTQGNIYLTGAVTQFPATPGAAQAQPGGGMCPVIPPNPLTLPCTDAFVAKISAATGAVVYATYLGGNTNDGGTGIAVDPVGNVYVTGYTNGDFPVTPNAFSPFPGAGIFVAKLSPDGSRFLYSTHLPGAVPFPGEFKLEAPRTPAPAIAVDAQGNAYVTGPAATGGSFVVKLSPETKVSPCRPMRPGTSM
jgi:beta-propeller repeat-containing protein